MVVDRCICHKAPLSELKEDAARIAQEAGDAISDHEIRRRLSDETGCGQSCGLCGPYLLLMIRSGKTELPILTAEVWQQLHDEMEQTARSTG